MFLTERVADLVGQDGKQVHAVLHPPMPPLRRGGAGGLPGVVNSESSPGVRSTNQPRPGTLVPGVRPVFLRLRCREFLPPYTATSASVKRSRSNVSRTRLAKKKSRPPLPMSVLARPLERTVLAFKIGAPFVPFLRLATRVA